MRYSLERLSKHKDPKGFLLSNILFDPDWTPFKYRDDRSKMVYLEWKRRTDALLYNFEQDLNRMIEPFSENFLCRDGRPPSLLLSHLAGIIGAETVAILLGITKLGKVWFDKLHMNDHPHCQVAFRLSKYSGFLDYDKEHYLSRITEKFGEKENIGWTSSALSA
jgi:hypothetical protein